MSISSDACIVVQINPKIVLVSHFRAYLALSYKGGEIYFAALKCLKPRSTYLRSYHESTSVICEPRYFHKLCLHVHNYSFLLIRRAEDLTYLAQLQYACLLEICKRPRPARVSSARLHVLLKSATEVGHVPKTAAGHVAEGR